MRYSGCAVPDVVERQRAVPCQRLADPLDGPANLGADDADLEHVAAAGSLRNLAIDMAGDEPPAIEHRLSALQRSGDSVLDQQAFGERIARLELDQQCIAAERIGHAPD